MPTMLPAQQPLQFIFTPTGFYPEIPYDNVGEESEKNDLRWRTGDVYHNLYEYALQGKPENLSPTENFLYLVADAFFGRLTDLPELELVRENAVVTLDDDTADRLLLSVPFAIGTEYVTREWIEIVFGHLLAIFASEISVYEGTVELYLTEKNQKLHVPERIFFHLVEQKDADYPFAFLATYATQDENGKVKHVPLRYALTEYKDNREKLLALFACLDRAAEVSELISGFVLNGELFHPLRLTAQEAYDFLKHVEAIEETGILCRIPNWWRKKSYAVGTTLCLGQEQPSMVGFDALISMVPSLTLDGETLTPDDIKELLDQTEGLALLKGKWVEVNHARLKKLLDEMEENKGQITLMDALRMELEPSKEAADIGPLITNGSWLSWLLSNLRHPENIREKELPDTLHAMLRPYQQNGYAWLNYMDTLGFGACLADDMGLGKTVQVLAYLEKMRLDQPDAHVLLVVPASLIGNWQNEAKKFTPGMELNILHGKSAALLGKEALHPPFLSITTYGMVSRISQLQDMQWTCIILDEAQAIKNPLTKQTRQIKKLRSRMKIAMTGTPIENDLTNLWSLFDFLNKGLMGTSQEFKSYCKGLTDRPEQYAHLKAMVSPFMLRRVKTDKSIIADLPDKLETIDYVGMSKKQIVLYRKIVADMEDKIRDSSGMERRGIVLAAIMKLKQICNHPDQYLGQAAYSPSESGKFEMLREICETIYAKRERVLVFTQFREITDYLADFLKEIFHRDGYILHGGVPVKERTKIVEAFQGDQYVPFIVLSVRAGGTGLNLTKANHVIHFDRWWNPAVENQATDRAFRIGQTKNVMVHKLVCKGTIEEKIDAIINSKKDLAENVIGSGSENWITELGNDELFKLLKLDA